MRQEYEPAASLDRLHEHPENPRRGDDAAVADSVDVLGFYGAIIAQASTGYVLAGHTRRRVMLARGEEAAPVLWLDVDDDTARRILLADNRTAELAAWDQGQLLALLEELAAEENELAGVGFTGDDLAALQRQLGAVEHGEVDYRREWDAAGMPDYQSNDLNSAFRTVVHFRSEEDAQRFFAEIGRPLKKSWWWPDTDGHVGLLSDARVVATADA